MEHKAFLFDYGLFAQELKVILEDALQSGDVYALTSFINANLSDFRDPYEGDPLEADWEAMIATRDPHQFGDFAITKYYRPDKDIGLGKSWETLQNMIAADPLIVESPILGSILGPRSNPFDPGKMGSYFQSAQQVQQSQGCLLNFVRTGRVEVIDQAVQMLQRAIGANMGLYITF